MASAEPSTDYHDVSGLLRYGSDEQQSYISCQPCSEDGYYNEPISYCRDCVENLCKKCVRAHLRAKPLRHHRLVGGDTELADNNVPAERECIEKCKVHTDKVLEYRVGTFDKTLVCNVCLLRNHTLCDGNVIYIPEYCGEEIRDSELQDMKETLAKLEAELEDEQRQTKANMDNTKLWGDKCKDNINAYRKDINLVLDKLEDEVDVKIAEITKENMKTMTDLGRRLSELTRVVKKTSSEIDSQKPELKGQVYVSLKRAEASVDEIQAFIRKIENVNVVTFFSFRREQSLLDQIESTYGGLFNENIANIFARKERLFQPKESVGKHVFKIAKGNFNVTDVDVVSENQAIVADYFSNRVALADLRYDSWMITYPVDVPKPGKVAKIQDGLLAVACRGGIKFIKMSNHLILEGDIPMKGTSMCLTGVSGRLAVVWLDQFNSQLEPGLKIIDVDGSVYRDIQQCRFNAIRPDVKISSRTLAVVASPDCEYIYVADSVMGHVTCFSEKGGRIGVYSSLANPKGLTVDRRGFVYACGKDGVVCVTPDCRQGRTVYAHRNWECYCMTYYETTNSLLVGCDRMIEVVKLSYTGLTD